MKTPLDSLLLILLVGVAIGALALWVGPALHTLLTHTAASLDVTAIQPYP